MNRSELHGCNHVYQFTIQQAFKSKHFKIFTIILFLIALLSMPAIELITNGINSEGKQSDIKKVYVIDDTGLPLADYNIIKEDFNIYQDTIFEYTDKSRDEIEKDLEKEENGSLLLHIKEEDGFYNMQIVRVPEGKISEIEAINFSEIMREAFTENIIQNLSISQEQIDMLEEPIFIEVQTYTDLEDDIEEDVSVTYNEYNLILAALVFIMMMISYGGSGVATTIVTEKSTKLIEVLLTRIRPMAIIVGKVLAMLTITIIQLLFAIFGLGLSGLIYKAMFNSENLLPEMIYGALEINVLQNISLINIILAIIIYIVGFIFYAFLAGLTGATVSKIEDLQEGMMFYTIITIVGAYMGLGLVMMSLQGSPSRLFANVTFLLPISSVFITPIYLLMGKVSIIMALIAIVILTISTIILVGFTSKVYQTLILHQGNVIKVKDIITISKAKKEAR